MCQSIIENKQSVTYFVRRSTIIFVISLWSPISISTSRFEYLLLSSSMLMMSFIFWLLTGIPSLKRRIFPTRTSGLSAVSNDSSAQFIKTFWSE